MSVDEQRVDPPEVSLTRRAESDQHLGKGMNLHVAAADGVGRLGHSEKVGDRSRSRTAMGTLAIFGHEVPLLLVLQIAAALIVIGVFSLIIAYQQPELDHLGRLQTATCLFLS
jgi:hypothetical protein